MRLHRLQLELAATGADVHAVVPLLAPILGLAPSTGYEPVAVEGRKLNDAITDAAYEYLVNCNGAGAGVLLVEDLQWIDESTRALLVRLLTGGPGTVLVVITSREARAVRSGRCARARAPHGGRAHRPRRRPRTRRPLADRASALAERSDGVPLFVEELVRGWDRMAEAEGAIPSNDSLPDALYEPLAAGSCRRARG